MHKWQLQEAKQKFSELVQRTLDEGPQAVTRHGKEVVVVLSTAEYERLTGEKGPNFKEFLLSGPPWFDDLEPFLERSKDPPRPVDL